MDKSSAFFGLLLVSFFCSCASSDSLQHRTDTPNEEFAGAELQLVRQIAPIDVVRADGTPYQRPFLGGLNSPRPQLIDIDGDGDTDLFVQEYTGSVMFFENVGDGQFRYRSSKYEDLDIGEWYRFADVDRDGDYDLLSEEPYSYIRYYRNEGTADDPNFVLAVDTLRDVDGTAMFSDRQNIPNATDIDCDGQTDLFVGRLDGTVTRYEAVGDLETPIFRLVNDRFEDIEIVAQFGQPGNPSAVMPNIPRTDDVPDSGPLAASDDGTQRHGANTMTFADMDGDGDMDLFWGDFFEPSLLIIENTGTCETPSLRSEPEPFPPPDPVLSSGYNAPTFGDVDGDGDLDLLVGVLGGAFNPNLTAGANLYYYEQLENGMFTLRTRNFLDQLDLGSESYPRLADLDGDGRPELYVANKISAENSRTSVLVRFENTGSGYRMRDSLALIPSYHYAPAFGDLDADGDADMLLGTWNDGVALYRNVGSPTSPDLELDAEGFIELTRGSHATPALVDIDDDGDLDLFVGETSGTINFYRNDGSPNEPVFELVSDEYLNIDVGRRSVPVFWDIDGDGDQDMIVGSEDEGIVLFRNTGTPREPAFEYEGALQLDAPPIAVPEFGDVDGDGVAELIIGGLGGGLFFYGSGTTGLEGSGPTP